MFVFESSDSKSAEISEGFLAVSDVIGTDRFDLNVLTFTITMKLDVLIYNCLLLRGTRTLIWFQLQRNDAWA